MTEELDALIARLRELLEKATPGPWDVDTTENEGEYGSGPDTRSGFKSPIMFGPDGEALFDAINSDIIEVHEDGPDEDGYYYAWDEPGAANFSFVAEARNNLPTLLDALESLRAQLKTVLDREAETIRRYDAKLDGVEAALEAIRTELREARP